MKTTEIKLLNEDCIEAMRHMQSKSVDLVLTDPPYNIGVKTIKNGKAQKNQWDIIENYDCFMKNWIKECERLLKDNGVMYFWHNDMEEIARLMEWIRGNTSLHFISFCIWDKGDGYRAQSWRDRVPDGKTALRSWFNRCEYCLHYVKGGKEGKWKKTGLERIYSNPECFKSIKIWYKQELDRLSLCDGDIKDQYTRATGKKPYMLGHYFNDSQFEIPTKKVYEEVYIPLGFTRKYEDLRKEYEDLRKEYEDLRKEYEDLRKEYEDLRYVHKCDENHCNVWRVNPVPSNNRRHTCQKSLEILCRIIRVSSKPGAVVLDCFMGSGSTGVAAKAEGRSFIGIEKNPEYYERAKKWIENEVFQLNLF